MREPNSNHLSWFVLNYCFLNDKPQNYVNQQSKLYICFQIFKCRCSLKVKLQKHSLHLFLRSNIVLQHYCCQLLQFYLAAFTVLACGFHSLRGFSSQCLRFLQRLRRSFCVCFPRILNILRPALLRQHWADIGCKKNDKPVRLAVHSNLFTSPTLRKILRW